MSYDQVLSLMLLIFNSVIDLWKKKISLISVGIYFIVWILICIFSSNHTILLPDVFLDMMPGMILIIVGKISKGALGMGDGILVTTMGICMNRLIISKMLLWAFLLAFAWAVTQWCICKENGSKVFPFVPFLFLGYVMTFFV